MKPEKVSDDMDEIVWDPVDLFVDIGLLITEARTPSLCPKGRVEGPHCPSVQGMSNHDCDKHREQCRKSGQQRQRMLKLARNNIPMRLDTLLMPNCNHGQLEASTVEGPMIASQDPGMLLERWDVQFLPKRLDRTDMNYVTCRVLLQAIRSYLHFSQLSSWLTSQRGALPDQIVYRLYAPGESVRFGFSTHSDVHHFPLSDLTHSTMRVTVTSIQRLQTIPVLLCVEDDLSPGQHWRRKGQVAGSDLLMTDDIEVKDQGVRSKIYGKDLKDISVGLDRGLHRKKSPDFIAVDKNKDFAEKNHNKRTPLELYGPDLCDDLVQFDPRISRRKSPELHNKDGHEDTYYCDKGFSRKKSPELFPEDENVPNFHKSHIPKNIGAHRPPAGPVAQSQKPVSNFHSNQFENTQKTSYGQPYGLPSSNKTSSNTCAVTDLKLKTLPPAGHHHSNKIHSPGAISACKESFKEHPLKLSKDQNFSQDNRYDQDTLSKRLPSPKVLLTSSSSKGNTTFFKKRNLDLGKPCDSYDDISGSDILTDAFSDLMAPLKPEDLEAYLTSLRMPETVVQETTLHNIPLTKCKFYIGEDHSSTHQQQKKSNAKTQEVEITNKDNFKFNVDLSLGHSNQLNKENFKDTETPKVSKVVTQTNTTKPVRNLFKKSLSEPGPSLHNLELQSVPIDISQSHSDTSAIDTGVENISHSHVKVLKNEATAVDSGEDHGENGYSDDSTPTNSLSETFDVTTVTSSTLSSSPCNVKTVGNHPRPSPQSLSSKETTAIDNHFAKDLTNGSHGIRDDSCIDNELLKLHISDITNANSSLSSTKNCVNYFSAKIEDVETCRRDVPVREMVVDDQNTMKKPCKESTLCKQLLTKELQKNLQNENHLDSSFSVEDKMPNRDDMMQFRKTLGRSATLIFNTNTGLPTRSSPAPTKRKSAGRFEYDSTLINARAIKNALSCSKLALQSESYLDDLTDSDQKILSTSAPASTNCLLGNFEESMLNGRIEPVGVVEGFSTEIGAGGAFCPKHINLPVTAYFFQLSDDNAPSPYLGHINLDSLGKRGYHIPKAGTLQVTLFNPNRTVVKMFVVMYDLSDMPANSQTFLRQRTLYTPVDPNSTEPSYLRYLIHLRLASSKTGKVYLHTDIRLIFARDKFEFDPRVANYELRSFTEGPQNPKFSPKR